MMVLMVTLIVTYSISAAADFVLLGQGLHHRLADRGVTGYLSCRWRALHHRVVTLIDGTA